MIDNSNSSDFGTDDSRGNAHPLPAGSDSIISGFTEENICGEGASCTVYCIYLDGMRLAVKRLRHDFLSDPTYLASYRKECRIGQRLKHDALPLYRDFKQTGDEAYIVMDFVDGVSLKEFIHTPEGNEYFSSAENVRDFLWQLLDVVGYLHRSGVIHCDLKPSNIMLRNSDRRLMLLDLDKCYSDTLDRTHGGTPSISDPLQSGEKPTMQKDFAAISRIIDRIAETVDDFPSSAFRKFRKECESGKAKIAVLNKALETPRPFHWGNIAAILVPATVIIAFWSFSSKSPDNVAAAFPVVDTLILKDTDKDTVLPVALPAVQPEQVTTAPKVEKQTQPEKSTVSPVEPKKLVITVEEVEKGLSKLKNEIDRQYTLLKNGELTNAQISDIVLELGMMYPTEYSKMRMSYCAANPDMPSVDVEMALARAYEASKISQYFSMFMQACADTITLRKAKEGIH